MNDNTAPTVAQQRLVSPRVGEQIAEELNRASNIIASYYEKHKSEMPANVACALTREMMRLRDLAARVMPALQEEGEEGQQSNIQTLKTSHPNGTQAMSTPKEPIPSPASVPFGIWQPFATAPRDRPILVAWGTVASGAIGWDIVKHKYDDKWKSENSDDILPEGGYSAIAWMPLPPLPNDQGDGRRDGGSKSPAS